MPFTIRLPNAPQVGLSGCTTQGGAGNMGCGGVSRRPLAACNRDAQRLVDEGFVRA